MNTLENLPLENANNVFNWKLDKPITNSIFLKKKMVEYTNIKLIYGFLATNMGISYIGNCKYKSNVAYGVNTEQEQIENYKKMYNKKLSAFQLGFILPKHKWGRIIPCNYTSLSVFRRETRHRLSRDFYIDIDMVNAQPTIIYEICRMNNIEKNTLKKYVQNPKKFREYVMKHHNCDKDTAKTLFICLMFGGCYNSWLTDNDIQENKNKKIKEVNDLEEELKSVMDIVYNTNKNIKDDVLRADPQKWTTENDAKRGVMALWCQTIERLLQENVIKWLIDNKGFQIEKIVPCQDGFMILKELWYDEILLDASKSLRDTFGINIQFLNKPFDEAIEIPEFENDKNLDEWEDILSYKKLADKFLELFGHHIIKYKSSVYVYWLDNCGGRWYDETNIKNQHKLTLYISENLYDNIRDALLQAVEIESKDRTRLLKVLRNHTSKSCAINDIIKHILSKAKETETDFNQNPFLLGFNNGVYDLTKHIFRPYKFDDYMTISTGYDYQPLDLSNPLIQELENIINTIQPIESHRKLLLQMLASGLDGRLYQKLFLLNGAGGNGKGLISSLMKIMLGGYAYQPTNGILKDVEKSNAPSPDIYNLKNKRYINFTEVGGLIRVAMLRNLTGGTTFSGRLLNQNPESFKLSATFSMEFNNAPELDGKPQQADYRRLVDIYFPVNFTDDQNKIGQEIGGVRFEKSNPYYETEDFILSMRNVFLHKLLSVYRDNYIESVGINFTIPEDIRKRTETFIENQNLFQKVFNDLYIKVNVIPNNKADLKLKSVKIRTVWEDIIMSQEYRAITYREKRQYGRDEFYKWIDTMGLKTTNDTKAKCIIGIQKRDNIEEDEDEEQDNLLDNGINPLNV
jgi:phage/plasmid-associated DNA primase